MDRVPQAVTSWLQRQLVDRYRDVNATYYDVVSTLGQYQSLKVDTEVYTFDNGHEALLVRIQGNLSAQFRGTNYAYPIHIWVPQEYPAWPPLIYVRPFQGVSISPNQHVGSDGRIYHPYLGESWQPGRSNIIGALGVIVDIFSREPPLRATRNQAPPAPAQVGRSESLRTQQTASPRHSLAPALPPKGDQDRPQRTVASPPASSQGPPPRPPKPGDGATGPPVPAYRDYSQQRPGSVVGQPHLPPQQPISPQGPPPGQQHWQGQQSPVQYRQQQPPWQQIPQQGPPTQGMPPQKPQYRATPPVPIPQPQQQGRQALQPGQPQPPQNYQQRPSGPPQPISQAPQQWQHQPPPQPKPAANPPIDLLTSPFDIPLPAVTSASNLPVPPVPPNPEKDALLSAISSTLTTQLTTTLQSNASALPSLQAQSTALSSALSSLQAEFAHLRALETQVKANESTLHASLKEADIAIADAKQRPVPNIDETLIAPTVLSNQIYLLVAEEKSAVAAREVLGKGLDRGRLGAEQWVRSVRGVAREEWLKKWLVRRAAKGLGLHGVGGNVEGLEYGSAEKEVAGVQDETSYYR